MAWVSRRFLAGLARKALLLLALLLVTMGSAILTMRTAMSMHIVTVPTLHGLRMPQASALLARSGLTVRLVGKRYDAAVPAGLVATQEPEPGAPLKTERNVRVWLSLGPRQIEIPTLVGTSLRSARLALDLVKVPLGRVVEVHAPAPEGDILMQWPPPGTTDALDEQGVSLLVSRGPGGVEYVMPDLIGSPVDNVIEGLRRANLKVTDIRYRPYPGRAPGTVIGQYPRPGFRVGPRTPITLDVNRDTP